MVKSKETEISITITLEEAQAKLKDLVHQLEPGDEIIITENQHTVARLVSENPQQRKPRVPRLGKGMITLLVEDDEHLDGFFEAYSDVQWLRSRPSRVEMMLPDETEAGFAGKQPARGLIASNNYRPVSDALMGYRP